MILGYRAKVELGLGDVNLLTNPAGAEIELVGAAELAVGVAFANAEVEDVEARSIEHAVRQADFAADGSVRRPWVRNKNALAASIRLLVYQQVGERRLLVVDRPE